MDATPDEPRAGTRDARYTLYSGACFGGSLLALGAITDVALVLTGYGLLAGSLAVAAGFEIAAE